MTCGLSPTGLVALTARGGPHPHLKGFRIGVAWASLWTAYQSLPLNADPVVISYLGFLAVVAVLGLLTVDAARVAGRLNRGETVSAFEWM